MKFNLVVSHNCYKKLRLLLNLMIKSLIGIFGSRVQTGTKVHTFEKNVWKVFGFTKKF